MLSSIALFLIKYKWIILFYSIIILLIYFNREKFQVQSKVVYLYRSKFGLNFINKITKKYKEFIKIIGYIGIGVAYIGLVTISFYLIKGLFKLFTTPDAEASIGLVIPGVHIPGSPIFIPFGFGIIALFIVVLVHEFGHGIVARAHNLKIKSSGFGMFAIFPIAFVEPDEKELKKQRDTVQYSIFAAGPLFNIILTLIVVLLLSAVIFPVQTSVTENIGFSINGVQEGFPAEVAGLTGGMMITETNNVKTLDYTSFSKEFSHIRPGEEITIVANNTSYTVITTQHPDDPSQAYLGILGLKNEFKLKSESQISKILFAILTWFRELFQWIAILSLGIGMANLLPLGPVDGGRVLQLSLHKLIGKEKGNKLWMRISLVCLFILALNLFYPILRSLF